MKSEAAEQVAAPAESSNTQLAPGTDAHDRVRVEGWRQRLGGEQQWRWQRRLFLFVDRLYFVRVSAAAVKALRFAPTAGAARRARPGLRPLTPKIPNHPVNEKKKSNQGLDVAGPSHGRPQRRVAEDAERLETGEEELLPWN